MIDKKTRGKIIELWNEGESKASIQRETGVSQPTIRRILKEAGLEKSSRINGDESSDYSSQMLEERISDMKEEIENLKRERTLRHSTQFLVNLRLNHPYGNNSPWEMLRNGLPIWDLPRVLSMIFSPSIVHGIMSQIYRHGGTGMTYDVQILRGQDGVDDVRVQPLRLTP